MAPRPHELTTPPTQQFPYALSALPAYLSTHWTDETFKTQHLAAFPPEHATSPATLTAHVEDLTAHDVKAPYLKALQGTLWDAGYRAGAYAAPVYADVLAFLDRWTGEGEGESHTDHNGHESGKRTLQVAIYSSGSVAAQKLFFEHIATPEPSQTADPNSKANTPPKVQDCRPAITAWFDTVNAGPKQEAASYTTIATSLGTHNHQHEPAEILFLSDNVAEVRAALAAGMKSVVVERHGNAPLSDKDRAELQVVTSFEELDLE